MRRRPASWPCYLVVHSLETTSYCRPIAKGRLAAMTALTPGSRAALKKESSATLTTVLFKRGLRNVFVQEDFLLNQKSPRMVGDAFTLRFIPDPQDLDQLAD